MRRLRVKEVAQARGFTIARLERTAGIDIKTVRSIWHNPRHNASFDTLEKIAAALGVSVTTLIEDDNPSTQAESAAQIGPLDQITQGLRELDRLVHYEKQGRHLLEPSSPYTDVSSDEVENAKRRLQALLPNGLTVMYVQEYHANGIFASDTSSPNLSDTNYPAS